MKKKAENTQVPITISLRRLEDLGRIAEKMNGLLDHAVIETCQDLRSSGDFAEFYYDREKLEELFCKLQDLKDKLYDIWEISRWGDGDGSL